MDFALDPRLPPRPYIPRSRFERAGLSPREERWFNLFSTVLVVAFIAGWGFAVTRALGTGTTPPLLSGTVTANPLGADAGPQAVYLLDAAIRALAGREFRGQSGAVNVVVRTPGDSIATPDSLPAGAALRYGTSAADTVSAPPRTPGIWNMMIAVKGALRSVPDLHVVTLVPLSEKRRGRIGNYMIGSWPYESGGRPRSPQYAPPPGLVRVTPENMNTQVSEHFRLRDFLTKGQQNVWPKYVAMSPQLLDKLELTIQELNASGIPVQHVGVISGFRTPQYNAEGGSTAGRGALSRHMYGDAMDWYVDNDRNGAMDDVNKDGRVNKEDGRVLGKAAERVERKYPELVGGIGLYNPNPGAHSGFVHLDTRGYRARWGW